MANTYITSSDLIGRLFNRTDELIQNVASKYFPFIQGDPSTIIKNTIEVSPWDCKNNILLIICVYKIVKTACNEWVNTETVCHY
jgi:hypothetical protein